MTLSLDAVDLEVADISTARAFYGAAFAATTKDLGEDARIELRGAGQLGLIANLDLAAAGFAGCVLNCIVSQPSEVVALANAAARHGADVLKPPKKGLFGGFTAVLRTADGAIWKLAAPTKKDTGPATDPPTPTEVVAILGVAEPKASKAFYEALGMTVDRDYGSRFVDFAFEPGTWRLGLMPGKELVKDAGVDAGRDGVGTVRLTHRTSDPSEVDQLLALAASAGGQIAAAARETAQGAYVGRFADLDGHAWTVTSS